MIRKKKLRTAVIGLGRIGWMYHIPEIAAHSEFELTGVCDSLPERLSEAAQLYNVNTYSGVEWMLENESPDLVVVASPTKFHLSHTMAAFKKGCDVFCEKPAMLSIDEMEKVLDGMLEYGRKFMVYHPYRSSSDLQCLKDILGRGILGRVYMIKRTRTDYVRRCDWQAFNEFGGGMLNNYGSHFIDQLLHLGDCGSAILDVNSNMWMAKYFVPDELQDVSINTDLAAKGRSYSNGETIPWRLKEFKLTDFDPIDYYQQCYDYFAMDKRPFVDISESRLLIDVIEKCRNSSSIE